MIDFLSQVVIFKVAYLSFMNNSVVVFDVGGHVIAALTSNIQYQAVHQFCASLIVL